MGQVISALLPAVSAGASAKIANLGLVPVYEATDTMAAKVSLVAPSTVAAQGGTNFLTVQVRRIPLASGTPGTPVVMAAHNLGTTALTADTPTTETITAPADAGGDIIEVWGLQTGTGGVLPANTLCQVELT